MDMPETTAHGTTIRTHEEPHIHEFTAIYGSHYVFGDRLYLYMTALLSAAWLSVLWRRYAARDLNAGCWYIWDAFGIGVVATLSQKQEWAMACVFTSFFLVWTRLPGSPLDSFRLPSFGTFLETSTKRSTTNLKNAETADSQPECIVCWSSDDIPALLPCNHLICRDCLSAMKDRQQTRCPLCRIKLFQVNEGLQFAVHKAAAAFFAARMTAESLHLFLKLWHCRYWDGFQSSSVTYFPPLGCLVVLRNAVMMSRTDWWRAGIFKYLIPVPLPETRFGRSAWLAAMFAFLFAAGVLQTLEKIGDLDFVLDKVVHRRPLPEL